MVLFGKEININTNLSPKEAKLMLLIISIVIVIIFGYFKIFVPIMEIRDLSNQIQLKTTERNNEENKKRSAQRDYDNRLQVYNEQNENYNRSKEKFEQASLTDDTKLKLMVTEIAEELGIKIIEVGAVSEVKENEEYLKKFFPYTIQTDVNRLGRFLGILERANQLTTFKGNPLEIQLNGSDGISGDLTIKLKIGAYFNDVSIPTESVGVEGE